MNSKELTLEFKNWNIDEIILELSRHIDNGYHITTWSCNCGLMEVSAEVSLIYRGKR